jgi:hypothetical protein
VIAFVLTDTPAKPKEVERESRVPIFVLPPGVSDPRFADAWRKDTGERLSERVSTLANPSLPWPVGMTFELALYTNPVVVTDRGIRLELLEVEVVEP